MVCQVYNQYAHPLVGVVHGLPTSWEPIIATVHLEDLFSMAAWSPCNRFIAVETFQGVEIRDAATLDLLTSFEIIPNQYTEGVIFSPDGHSVIQFSPYNIIIRDLQTGGSVDLTQFTQLYVDHSNFSSTYSVDGKMLAVTCSKAPKGPHKLPYKPPRKDSPTYIATYDLSTTRRQFYCVTEGYITPSIWTHGEFFRFATLKSEYITIWEAKFTLTSPPKVVKSFPTPDEIVDTEMVQAFLFLPAISRLAIALKDAVLLWDAFDSKLLLRYLLPEPRMSFSPNGCFFMCAVWNTKEIYVWKESPAGYTLHQKLLLFGFMQNSMPLFSPNGESIFITLSSKIHLWHTKDAILPSDLTLVVGEGKFILGFSPNKEFVAFTCEQEGKVVILDLQSNGPQLTINTGVDVVCLRVTKSIIIVCSEEEVITWDLAVGNTGTNIENIVQITTLNHPQQSDLELYEMSISPNLCYVAALYLPEGGDRYTDLRIYSVSNGRCLTHTIFDHHFLFGLCFTLDGHEIWARVIYGESSHIEGCLIVEDSKASIIQLQHLDKSQLAGVPPWQSSCGYKITDDGWILSPVQKRLLWLPHRWRSVEWHREWAGQFLGLFHEELSEVVILEFFD